MTYRFEDRGTAGAEHADKIGQRKFHDPIILAVSPGGVRVAAEVHRKTGIPWEVIHVRRLPDRLGAVSEDGQFVLSPLAYLREGVLEDSVSALLAAEEEAATRQSGDLRRRQPLPALDRRDAIIIDDGIVTGITGATAAKLLRSLGAERVFLAVPICPEAENPLLSDFVDEVICLEQSTEFREINSYYRRPLKADDAVL